MPNWFPDVGRDDFGKYVLHVLELLAAVSLACIGFAIVFGALARHSHGRRRTVWTCLAVVAGLSALMPAGYVLFVVALVSRVQP